MRSSIFFHFIILITGTISAFVKAGKVELTQFKLTFTEAVALNNLRSVDFIAKLNGKEPVFYCYSFWAQNPVEARDKRRGQCSSIGDGVETLWFNLKSVSAVSFPPDTSIPPSGEIELELYYFKTPQDNLQVIKVGIPGRQLQLDDLGSSQLRVKTIRGQTVENYY